MFLSEEGAASAELTSSDRLGTLEEKSPIHLESSQAFVDSYVVFLK